MGTGKGVSIWLKKFLLGSVDAILRFMFYCLFFVLYMYSVRIYSRGRYFQKRRSGGLDLTSGLEAKFGVRSGQVHKIRGKIWEVLSPKDAKVGKKYQFWGHAEIQRTKFGVFVIYTFGGKIWGSNKNFRGKIWGQAPTPDLLIWKYPPGNLLQV